MDQRVPSERSRVRRLAARGAYDSETVRAIIDATRVCHVGVASEGQPRVIPMIHARIDHTLYLHGSVGSGLLRTIGAGAEVCIAFTLVDALRFATTGLHHSMNYRSAVVFGTGRPVPEGEEKRAALDAFVEHVLAGRVAEMPPPTEEESRATQVVAIEIDDASAKIRSGPANDADAEKFPERWIGQVPLATIVNTPIPDPPCASVDLPASVRRLIDG